MDDNYTSSTPGNITANWTPYDSNKPFIQIYKSDKVGIGKSYMINQKAMKINKNFDDNSYIIRIPFNSSNIDLDFMLINYINVMMVNKEIKLFIILIYHHQQQIQLIMYYLIYVFH